MNPPSPRKPPLVRADLADHDLPGIGHRYELRADTQSRTLGAIVRDLQPMTAPEPAERLQARDQLVVIGRQEDPARLRHHLATPPTSSEAPDG